MSRWHNVSRREPCPICQKPDWCTLSDDGMMCVCKRVESPNPAKSGQGWIHILVERPKREWVPRMPKRPSIRLFQAEMAMIGYRAEFQAWKPRIDTGWNSMDCMQEDLMLPAESLARINPGRSEYHQAWAFPMLDGDGKCVGIRLREFGASNKWSVAGSHDGLFYDPQLQPAETISNCVRGREIVVVEGATDTIAGYALGLPCVGRSSCGTGAEHLRKLCSRLNVGRVTIVTDNDNYKLRPDGTPWRPGIEGAQRLAQQLGRLYRIITPPKKDLREWYYANLSAETFWTVANLQPWRLK